MASRMPNRIGGTHDIGGIFDEELIVNVWSDDGGSPGRPDQLLLTIPSGTVIRSAYPVTYVQWGSGTSVVDVYEYELSLASPFEATGGETYWLEIYDTTGDRWYWLTAPPGNGLSWQRVPPDGEWTSATQRGFDMAFSLLGEAGPECTEDADCYDADLCTIDTCAGMPDGSCMHTPIASRPYADVHPVPDGDGAVEIMDTLCILDAAEGEGDCVTDVGGFMIGDIFPCPLPEGAGPDGAVEIMDTLAVLDAAEGNPGCDPWCP